MDLQQLRQHTAADHDSTESSVPLMGSDLTVDQYISVLQRFHVVLCTWDRWAERHAPEDLTELVAQRQRCALISADLRRMCPDYHETAFDDELALRLDQLLLAHGSPRAAFLGVMYVVEGSTLGGQYIAKHVEEHFGFAPGEGNAYFRGYGDQTMPMWRQFQAVLRQIPDDDAPVVFAAARGMFSIFGEWMRRPVQLPAAC